MKIYVFPADPDGCGHYRMIWPARELAARGHNLVIRMPHERHELQAVIQNDELIDVRVPDDADVVVLQRITHRYLTAAVRILRERYGVAVVVDIDDDLSRIHPRNPAFTLMHPKMNSGRPEHSWENLRRACNDATLVVTSTPALIARYAPHGRGCVIRNHVPQAYLDVPRVDSETVGWAGALHSHPDDLQVMGATASRLAHAGYRFSVVGPGAGVREVLGLLDEPTATGAIGIAGWPNAVAGLGVGVAPLADTQFNAAKSWLKILEYAALGVPCVASPRAEYAELHRLGVGILADKPKEWLRASLRLLRDASLRDEMSLAGREIARELTIEGNAWRWIEAWTEARRIQDGATPGLRDATRPGDFALRTTRRSPSLAALPQRP